MKYRDLIQFDPIKSVIQLKSSDNCDYAKELVRTYVASASMEQKFKKQIIPQLRYDQANNNFALMIIGNYGTGKSHLMSVISAIAENERYVSDLKSDEIRNSSAAIAGKFMVIRVEIGGVTTSLAELLEKGVIEKQFEEWGIDFKFPQAVVNHKDVLEAMMQAFSSKFPDKGLLIVIDEMLGFLQSKDVPHLVQDLEFLRVLGEFCQFSKFRLITGMQESLFDNPSFKFVASTVSKIKDRTDIVIIDKTDIKYVVTERLLQKSPSQKASIKQYLEKFKPCFESMSSEFDDFVDLFPVHPAYLTAFSKMIAIEKREVLKTISQELESIIDEDLPEELDLITIDKYWKRIENNPTFYVFSGMHDVTNCHKVLAGKIKSSMPVLYKKFANRIIDALSVQRLESTDVNSTIGMTTVELRDNLCLYNEMFASMGDSPEADILSQIQSTLNNIIKVSNGQYISEKNGQYYIDVRKTVDYDQQIKAQADALGDSKLDCYFFELMKMMLECSSGTEFIGAKIWDYELQWLSHNMFKNGWLFFGNPDERSTAVPEKEFYIYFLPPFTSVKFKNENRADEIIIEFKKYDDSFYSDLQLFAASSELAASSAVQIKSVYQNKADVYQRKLIAWLQNRVLDCFSITYKGDKKGISSWIKGKNLREESGIRNNEFLNFKNTFDIVASLLFDGYFAGLAPCYPKFSVKISSHNISQMLNDIVKVMIQGGTFTNTSISILNSLSLLENGHISVKESDYAQSILQLLDQKAQGTVLKRREIIDTYHGFGSEEFMVDSKYRLESKFVSVILLALVISGDIVLSFKNRKIDASNIKNLIGETVESIANFDMIEAPKDFNPAVIKALFNLVDLPEGYYNFVKQGRDDVVVSFHDSLLANIKILAKEIFLYSNGIKLWNIAEVFDFDVCDFISELKNQLEKLQHFNTCGKLKNITTSVDELVLLKADLLKAQEIRNYWKLVSEINDNMSWFSMAKTILPEDNSWNQKVLSTIESITKNTIGVSIENLEGYKDKLQKLKHEYCIEYSMLHDKGLLGRKDNVLLMQLYNNAEMKHLSELQRIDILPRGMFDKLKVELGAIKVCDGCTEEELLNNPVCPHCGYMPKQTLIGNAKVILSQLQDSLELMEKQWIGIIRNALNDPFNKENIMLLAGEKKEAVDYFLNNNMLPEDIDVFVDATNEVLKGMVKKNISVKDIQKYLFKDGKPLTADELKNNLEDLIQSVSRGEIIDKIRFVME